jgi:peptide/nickel transport system permease protein
VIARRVAAVLLGAIFVATIAAPLVAPNDPNEQFADRQYAPPTRIRIHDANGFRAPFIYPQVLEDRLLRQYREDRTRPVPLTWFSNGRVLSVAGGAGPLLILGADSMGRDLFARLLRGARLSLGVAFLGVLGAIAIGSLAGAMAGTFGGRFDTMLMLLADFVVVLPGAYLVLVLRGLLPPVLSTAASFALMSLLFAFAAWPHVARGVRAIVATERHREYAEAARAAGAGSFRLMWQLLPAARGFLGVEVVLLVPALLLAEVTLSFLGFGFDDRHASWGTMLQDSRHVVVLREAPWILAPAIALFVVALAVQLAGAARTSTALLIGGDPVARARRVDTPRPSR